MNVSILNVSVSGVPKYQLPDFCRFNETLAIITNLTIPNGWPLSVWASVEIEPIKGANSFKIYVDVNLRADWLHPRNTVIKILPIESIYNQTERQTYEKLK